MVFIGQNSLFGQMAVFACPLMGVIFFFDMKKGKRKKNDRFIRQPAWPFSPILTPGQDICPYHKHAWAGYVMAKLEQNS